MALHHKFEDEPINEQVNFVHVEGTKIEEGILTTSSFHPESGIREDDNGSIVIDGQGYNGRIAMDKNWRVGKLKFITSKSFDTRQHILVDVIEVCYNKFGEKYTANYNLWIAVPTDFPVNFTREHIGKYCLVGFYITSLRNKDMNAEYKTHLLLKYFKKLEYEQAESIANELHNTKHITL